MLAVNNNDFQFYLNRMIYTRQNPDVIVFLMIDGENQGRAVIRNKENFNRQKKLIYIYIDTHSHLLRMKM